MTATTDEMDVEAIRKLVATPDARLGSVDDPQIGFSLVGGVDVDDEDNVYVLEASVPEIRVYASDGSVLYRIGRRGGGPGEFETAPRFGVHGDTVWTVDPWRRRINLFDRRGTVLSAGNINAVAVPLPRGYGYVLPWIMRSDGTFASHFAVVGASRNDGPTNVQPTDSIPVPFVVFNTSGEVTDTVGWAERPPPRMWRPPSQEADPFQSVTVGNRRLMVPRPPSALPWWEPLADGYVLVTTPVPGTTEEAFFTVTRIGVTGDTAYSRVLRYEPVPYDSEALDSIAARAARGGPGGLVPYSPGAREIPDDWPRIARSLRDAMAFPALRPPFEYPWVAQDESVWIRRWDGVSPTANWIVLDPEGRPRGTLELPADVRIYWSRGNVLWATDPDEFDVPWLVRYTIQPT